MTALCITFDQTCKLFGNPVVTQIHEFNTYSIDVNIIRSINNTKYPCNRSVPDVVMHSNEMTGPQRRI